MRQVLSNSNIYYNDIITICWCEKMKFRLIIDSLRMSFCKFQENRLTVAYAKNKKKGNAKVSKQNYTQFLENCNKR